MVKNKMPELMHRNLHLGYTLGHDFIKMRKEKGIEIICSLMIILFVYAGLSKLLDYNTFKFQLGRSPYLTQFPGLIAWIIPAIELIISILLLCRQTRILGLYSSFFIMLLFTGYIYAMLHFSYFLPCSCGGVLSMMSWRQHLLFNIFFTLAALSGILLWREKQPEKVRPNKHGLLINDLWPQTGMKLNTCKKK